VRIWHVTKTVSGGAGQYALRLSNALRAEGLDSTVLASEGAASAGVARLIRIDSPIRRFAARVFRNVSHRISLEPFHSIRGPELYERPALIQAGDIVHLHGMTGWIGVGGLKKLIPKGTKVFWTAHDMWMLSGGCVVYTGSDGFKTTCVGCPILQPRWKRLAVSELKTKETFVKDYDIQPIANSQWMAARIRESKLYAHVTDVPVVPPIVDDAYFAQGIGNLRRELEIPADRKVISLGSRSVDDAFKGIPEFLNHLSSTAAVADKITILLFGPGALKIPLNLDVRMLGGISDVKELAKVYRTSDLFVSPSKMESFGMTLAEAQAVGTLAVSFETGGIRDAVHPELHKWLVSPSGPEGLLASVSELIKSQTTAIPSVGVLREWAKKIFGAKRVAAAQERVYKVDHN
jgi:glycosyltransferase involved in cell wall biosynthesis